MLHIEILEAQMDSENFNTVKLLVESGATWSFSNFTNEAALIHNEETYVVVDMEEFDFETTPLFEKLLRNLTW